MDSKLIKACKSIEDPTSYYSGIKYKVNGIPGNLLAFHRSSEQLNFSGIQSHYRSL